MTRFPYDAEAREDMVCQLIDARIKAMRTDILIRRQSTVDAVLECLELDTEDDAATVLWNAVAAGSSAVGVDNAAAVQLAIFQVAEALAEWDVADMERRRAESEDEARIEQATWHRVLA
jgi:hypothetical protein